MTERIAAPVDELIHEKEGCLSHLERLTFEGDNGESYFSPDGSRILYQSTMPGREYDQIYLMNRDGSARRMVSTGKGRTTCSYFTTQPNEFIYASTHLREVTPPKPQGHSYEWSFDEAYDIFLARLDGTIIRRLTGAPGYDAEGTISPSGTRLIWTSDRTGDLEVYTMKLDGTDVKQITKTRGYDGGAFFSPDETLIVYRGSRTENYKDLQIFVCKADGTDHRQLTDNDAVNFAPYFHPGGERIIFSSNMDEPRNFELYMIKVDGTGLTRITHSEAFDGFPFFSADGKELMFSSNRAAGGGRQTDIFVAQFSPYWE